MRARRGGTGTALIFVALALAAWFGLAAVAEDLAWSHYAEAHHCRLVAIRFGRDIVMSPDNPWATEPIAAMPRPRKVGYRCDDGKTYWR